MPQGNATVSKTMKTFEVAKQAFENAIKTVGLEQFKRTSVFMSNNRKAATEVESEAA